MPGFDGSVQIAYAQNDNTYYIKNFSDFVDGFFDDTSRTPVDEGSGVHSVDISDGSYSILYIDNIGQLKYSPITSAIRYTVGELPVAPDVVKITLAQGETVLCASDTLLSTRIDNNVASKAVSDYNVGDYLAQGQLNYIQTGGYPYVVKQVQYQVNTQTLVPNVITANWGDLTLNRDDLGSCLQAVEQDPSMDQSDIQILNNAIHENTEYGEITDIAPISAATYLYDLRTDAGDYQLLNGVHSGVPVIDFTW